MTITLRPFQAEHLRVLERWLREEHVTRWYPAPASDLSFAMSPPAHGSHALIFEGEVPIGYVRWTYVDRVTLDELGLYDVPANSVDIDILIGVASCTGNGRGVEALNLLAKQFLTDPAVPMLGLTTSLQNHQAQKAFSKAGFSISRQYDPNGFGLCYLMLRDLRKERGSVSSPSA